MESISLAVLTAVSLCANIALGLYLVLRARKPKETRLDVSAQDLLHDLTRRGHAVLKVEVIDPSQLLLRSPRG